MKLPVGWAIGIQLLLAALQYLLPAFIPMTSAQQGAIASFIGSAQGALGILAYKLNMDGTVTSPTPKPQDKPYN